MEDAAIVDLYWARDEQALAETAAKFGAYCRKIADNILHSAHDAERLISAFLRTLPEETRCIFLRRYWYCDATADIAARYGLTESKVRVTLHRTRGKLAAYLQERGAAL